MQQAFVLYFADDLQTNVYELNTLLAKGWSVVSVAPMSGSGETRQPEEIRTVMMSPFPYSRSLVILSHADTLQRFDQGEMIRARLGILEG